MTLTGLLLYCAVGLMVLTVVSNRYWRVQIRRARAAVRRAEEDAETVTGDLADAGRSCTELGKRVEEAAQSAVRAEQEAARAEADLEAMRQAAVERYYVFDRLEPRPGRFWEVAVSRTPGGRDWAGRDWAGGRRYLLIADGERAAREQAAARFPTRAGFAVAELVPCRLAGLTTPEPQAEEAPRRGRAPSALPRRAATAKSRSQRATESDLDQASPL